ncbi:transcriptional repressor general negative regulator of transcription subunit 4 [Chytridiales sp. JEL 0842]|nr:transcriptional repressor general negative regulator of transcription subunit 4 [Chytridiales sp. JEL 0842]
MGYSSDEEDLECPLCMEEIDITDKYFKPCPCGYQICRFCWNHIKEDLNGLCPACRRPYSDDSIEFKPVSPEEIARMKANKKRRERERKEMDNAARRHLANARVVQKNLIYIFGLPPKYSTEEYLRSPDFFGQYGKITRVITNRRGHGHTPVMSSLSPLGVYIMYTKKEDALRAIEATDGTFYDNRVLRVTYGTTKYCTYFLKNQPCQNTVCQYLHEPAEEADTFAKEEAGRQAARERQGRLVPFPVLLAHYKKEEKEESALPPTANWAKLGTAKPVSTPPHSADEMHSEDPDLATVAASLKAKTAPEAEEKKVKKKKAGSISSASQPAGLTTSLTGRSGSISGPSTRPPPEEERFLGSKALEDPENPSPVVNMPSSSRKPSTASKFAAAAAAAAALVSPSTFANLPDEISLHAIGFNLHPTYTGPFNPFSTQPFSFYLQDLKPSGEFGYFGMSPFRHDPFRDSSAVDAIASNDLSLQPEADDTSRSRFARFFGANNVDAGYDGDMERNTQEKRISASQRMGSSEDNAALQDVLGHWSQQGGRDSEATLRQQSQQMPQFGGFGGGAGGGGLRGGLGAMGGNGLYTQTAPGLRQTDFQLQQSQQLLNLQQQQQGGAPSQAQLFQRFQQQAQQQQTGFGLQQQNQQAEEFMGAFMREAQLRETQLQLREMQIRERAAAAVAAARGELPPGANLRMGPYGPVQDWGMGGGMGFGSGPDSTNPGLLRERQQDLAGLRTDQRGTLDSLRDLGSNLNNLQSQAQMDPQQLQHLARLRELQDREKDVASSLREQREWEMMARMQAMGGNPQGVASAGRGEEGAVLKKNEGGEEGGAEGVKERGVGVEVAANEESDNKAISGGRVTPLSYASVIGSAAVRGRKLSSNKLSSSTLSRPSSVGSTLSDSVVSSPSEPVERTTLEFEVVKSKSSSSKKKSSKDAVLDKVDPPSSVASEKVAAPKEEPMKITLVSARSLKAEKKASASSLRDSEPKVDSKPEVEVATEVVVESRAVLPDKSSEKDEEAPVATDATSATTAGSAKKAKKARAKAKKKKEKEMLAAEMEQFEKDIEEAMLEDSKSNSVEDLVSKGAEPVVEPEQEKADVKPAKEDVDSNVGSESQPAKSSRRKRAKERDRKKKEAELASAATAATSEDSSGLFDMSNVASDRLIQALGDARKKKEAELASAATSATSEDSSGLLDMSNVASQRFIQALGNAIAPTSGESAAASTNSVEFGHIIASIAAGFGSELKDILIESTAQKDLFKSSAESADPTASNVTANVDDSGNVLLNVYGVEMKLDTSAILNQVLQQLTASGMLRCDNGVIQEGSLKVEEVWTLLNHLGKAMKMGVVSQVPNSTAMASLASMSVNDLPAIAKMLQSSAVVQAGASGSASGEKQEAVAGPSSDAAPAAGSSLPQKPSSALARAIAELPPPPPPPTKVTPPVMTGSTLQDASVFLNQSSAYLSELVTCVRWMVTRGETLLNSPSLRLSDCFAEEIPEPIYQSEPIRLGTSKYVLTKPPSSTDKSKDGQGLPLEDMIDKLEKELAASKENERAATAKLKSIVERNRPWLKDFVASMGIDSSLADTMSADANLISTIIAAEFSVKYHLSASDSSSLSINELVSMTASLADDPVTKEMELWDKIKNTWLGYPDAYGSTELRSCIADNLYEGIKPEEVLIHSGAEEVIFTFCHGLLEPDDVVIVQSPCYQSLEELPCSIGCKVLLWDMTFQESKWNLPMDKLQLLIDQAGRKLKAIFINSPHNPTGYQLSRSQFKDILRIADENDVWVLSDEVYRLLEPAGAVPRDLRPGSTDNFLSSLQEHRLVPACQLYSKAISVNVLSKAFGLPGLRIGWAATQSEEAIQKMASIKDYTTNCCASPSETLAVMAIEARHPILKRTSAIAQDNLTALNDFFGRHTLWFEWMPPTVGCIGFAKLVPHSVFADACEFCEKLLEEEGILLLPGSMYGDAWSMYFRISWGRNDMEDALIQLERWLEKFIKASSII